MDAQTRYPRATDQAPRSLKIMAYLLMLGAGASLGGMVAGPILKDEFILNLGVVLYSLAALGLLLASKGWRVFLIVMLIFGALAMLSGMGITGHQLAIGAPGCDWWVFGPDAVTIVHILTILAYVGMFALVVWSVYVLFSPPVREWFGQPPHMRVAMTRRTMHMLILFAVLGLPLPFLSGIPAYVKKPVDTGLGTSSQERSLMVSYGYRYGRLAYVVFLEKPLGESMWFPVSSTFREDKPWFRTPQGEQIRLPNATQLYEIIDGKLRTSPERVSKEEFEAFMDSSRDRFTIDALLSFVSKRAAEPSRPKGGPE